MRILIAGLGSVGQRHARNIRALRPDAELFAFRRRRLSHVVTEQLNADASRNVENELNIEVFDDLARALDRRPQACIVCTPSSQHIEIALRAAQAGADLYLEKPVSHTLHGVQQLQQEVDNRALVTMVGCQWRFNPCVIRVKQMLEDGILGEVREASIEYAEYLPAWHPYEDYRQSYAARSELGGGVVLSHIHDYDLAWWLFGTPEWVMAEGGKESDLEIDVEDTVRAELRGAGTMVRVNQTFASRSNRRRVRVVGSVCAVTVDLLEGSLKVDGEAAPRFTVSNFDRNLMFLDAMSAFLSSVECRTRSPIPLSDGTAVLEIALAVKESLRSGHTISLRS